MSAQPTVRPEPRSRKEICNLNRHEMRALGLTSGGVMNLYDEARGKALAEGCNCGVVRIYPRPNGDGTFHVDVFHATGCTVRPLEEKRRKVRRGRLWRKLRLRGRRDSLVARYRYGWLRLSRWCRGLGREPTEG